MSKCGRVHMASVGDVTRVVGGRSRGDGREQHAGTEGEVRPLRLATRSVTRAHVRVSVIGGLVAPMQLAAPCRPQKPRR
jgi:hypothetical protein